MTLDFDTFLTALYTLIDDLYQEHFAPLKPVRCGAKPVMSDTEVLVLTILQHWGLAPSQSSLIRKVNAHWRCYFPNMLTQSAFNKRTRDLMAVLAALPAIIARYFSIWFALGSFHETADGVPIELMKRFRGLRTKLFGLEAQIGRGGSERGWYYGVKAMVVRNTLGLITGYVFGPANTEERWLLEALLRNRHMGPVPAPCPEELHEILGPRHTSSGQRVGPTGPMCMTGAGQAYHGPLLLDRGLSGEAWHQHWQEHYLADPVCTLTREQRAQSDEARALGRSLASARQGIETIFSVLNREHALDNTNARSWWGLRAEVAAKLCAYNCNILIKQLFGIEGLMKTIRPLELPPV